MKMILANIFFSSLFSLFIFVSYSSCYNPLIKVTSNYPYLLKHKVTGLFLCPEMAHMIPLDNLLPNLIEIPEGKAQGCQWIFDEDGHLRHYLSGAWMSYYLIGEGTGVLVTRRNVPAEKLTYKIISDEGYLVNKLGWAVIPNNGASYTPSPTAGINIVNQLMPMQVFEFIPSSSAMLVNFTLIGKPPKNGYTALVQKRIKNLSSASIVETIDFSTETTQSSEHSLTFDFRTSFTSSSTSSVSAVGQGGSASWETTISFTVEFGITTTEVNALISTKTNSDSLTIEVPANTTATITATYYKGTGRVPFLAYYQSITGYIFSVTGFYTFEQIYYQDINVVDTVTGSLDL